MVILFSLECLFQQNKYLVPIIDNFGEILSYYLSSLEPDLMCQLDDFTFSVAAKRIKTRAQLFKRIKEARKQIIKTGKPGIIAIDISQFQTLYYMPTTSIDAKLISRAADDFLDIEFESKLERIRKVTGNNKIIGIIAFSTYCAKDPNNHTHLICEHHNGSRLCKPNTEKASIVWTIIDMLSS